MEQIDVLAVVGSCAPERLLYAQRLAEMTQRMFVPAQRLAVSTDPVDEAASLAPWTDRPAGTVLEFPSHTVMTELIGTLTQANADTRLSAVVCVADAAHLLEDLSRDSYAVQPPLPRQQNMESRHIAHAMLTVTQLEYASVIMLVNWEILPTVELSTVLAVVSHLSPHARLRLHHGRIEPPRGERSTQLGRNGRDGWACSTRTSTRT